ncbi:MAG: hypothetical protein WCW68_09435 [Methanothrix sp.]
MSAKSRSSNANSEELRSCEPDFDELSFVEFKSKELKKEDTIFDELKSGELTVV